jgi:hypothetical protein
MALSVITLTISTGITTSGAADVKTSPAQGGASGAAARAHAPGGCPDARRGLAYYRSAVRGWRRKMGAAGVSSLARTGGSRRSCSWTHRAAKLVRERAIAGRRAYEHYRHERLNRYRRLYEKYRCIHEHEGAWNSETGNGYHGGLQFDDGFQRTYGPDFMRHWGNASNWPVWAQLEAAERAFWGYAGYGGRGFSPWGTRGVCGL